MQLDCISRARSRSSPRYSLYPLLDYIVLVAGIGSHIFAIATLEKHTNPIYTYIFVFHKTCYSNTAMDMYLLGIPVYRIIPLRRARAIVASRPLRLLPVTADRSTTRTTTGDADGGADAAEAGGTPSVDGWRRGARTAGKSAGEGEGEAGALRR